MNEKLASGWIRSRTIRLGLLGDRLFVDLLVEKERPQPRAEGKVVGMDSNYKNGLVFSDGQNVATELHQTIQGFAKRQKRTRVEMKSMIAQAIKRIDFSQIKMLVIEDLKKVKHGKRGTFSRVFNRRLSHWLYAYTASLLVRRCVSEAGRSPELGIEVQSHCTRGKPRNAVTLAVNGTNEIVEVIDSCA